MLAFRPFAAPPRPFTIGLKPVDRHNFLFVDAERPRYLAEKRALYASAETVVMAEPETVVAQAEAAALLLEAASRHPEYPVAKRHPRHDPRLRAGRSR